MAYRSASSLFVIRPVLLSKLLKMGVKLKTKKKFPNSLMIEPFGTAKAYISILKLQDKIKI